MPSYRAECAENVLQGCEQFFWLKTLLCICFWIGSAARFLRTLHISCIFKTSSSYNSFLESKARVSLRKDSLAWFLHRNKRTRFHLSKYYSDNQSTRCAGRYTTHAIEMQKPLSLRERLKEGIFRSSLIEFPGWWQSNIETNSIVRASRVTARNALEEGSVRSLTDTGYMKTLRSLCLRLIT